MTATLTKPASTMVRDKSTTSRRVAGLLRIVATIVLITGMTVQITELIANNAFKPEEYFSYFTIESSIINIAVLITGGVLALRWRTDSPLFTAIRMSTVAYAVVTAAVYNLLLRGVPSEGFVGVQWPNEVMHVFIPAYILLDWLFAPGRARLGFRWLWLVVSYPILWAAFTLIRGAITGWYPYPFINPTGAGGYPSVLGYIVGLSAFMVGLGCACVAISRTGAGRRAREV